MDLSCLTVVLEGWVRRGVEPRDCALFVTLLVRRIVTVREWDVVVGRGFSVVVEPIIHHRQLSAFVGRGEHEQIARLSQSLR